MPDPDSDAASSVPHDFIDAEISVEGLVTAGDEQALTAALNGLPGIRDFSISHGKIAMEYEPVRVTHIEIGEAIARAGFRIGKLETTSASPVGDALHGDGS